MENSPLIKESLKFEFMTSLQNIVSAKIVNCLWVTSNVKKGIILYTPDIFLIPLMGCGLESAPEWKEIECFVKRKVRKLGLPTSLTEILTAVVPPAGKSLLNWMRYLDSQVFNVEHFDDIKDEYCAADFINTIIWTARGKIDYARTARNILSNQHIILTKDHKFKLACTHCLEDQIVLFAPLVYPTQDRNYLTYWDIGRQPMVHFWTAVLTNDYAGLNKYYEAHFPDSAINISVYDIMFKIINSDDEEYFNEIPINYVWDKLSDEGRARGISLFMKFKHCEFKYTFLSSLDNEQQISVIKSHGGVILAGMLHERLWEPYFLETALQVLDDLSKESYEYLLQKLANKLEMCAGEGNKISHKYKFYFKKLWIKASEDLKEFVFNNFSCTFQNTFYYILRWDQDMDVIKALLNSLSAQQKKKLISDKSCFQFCERLITENEPPWPSLDFLINSTLNSEDDIFHFKELINEKNCIVYSLLREKTMNKLDYFLNWTFKSEETKRKFKQELFGKKTFCILDTFYSITDQNVVDFSKLENHFEWCSEGDQEVIKDFKSRVIQGSYVKYYMNSLILSDRYDLIDQVLKWGFCDNQRSVVQFKKNLYRMDIDEPSSWLRELIIKLIVESKSCKLLDKFVNWLFTDDKEVYKFKVWFLYPQMSCPNDATKSFLKLLREQQLKIADMLIEWCLKDPQEIAKYKAELMLSDSIVFRSWMSVPQLKCLVKWFNPSKEVINRFKYKMDDLPRTVYSVLDNYSSRVLL